MGAGAVTGSAWVLGMLQERPTHLGRALRAAEVDRGDENGVEARRSRKGRGRRCGGCAVACEVRERVCAVAVPAGGDEDERTRLDHFVQPSLRFRRPPSSIHRSLAPVHSAPQPGLCSYLHGCSSSAHLDSASRRSPRCALFPASSLAVTVRSQGSARAHQRLESRSARPSADAHDRTPTPSPLLTTAIHGNDGQSSLASLFLGRTSPSLTPSSSAAARSFPLSSSSPPSLVSFSPRPPPAASTRPCASASSSSPPPLPSPRPPR